MKNMPNNKRPWAWNMDLDQWALPFFVHWILAKRVRTFAVHFLCFSVSYEWWSDEQ